MMVVPTGDGDASLAARLRRAGARGTHGELAAALGQPLEEYNKYRLEVTISRLRARVFRITDYSRSFAFIRG